jgi:hypothetical protein
LAEDVLAGADPAVHFGMNLTKLLAILLTVTAAFLAGLWIERAPRLAAEQELAAARARVARVESRAAATTLLARLLLLIDATAQGDYRVARELATDFFDAVRAASGSEDSEMRRALGTVLDRRDAVTAALVREDPAVVESLRWALGRLREPLGLAGADWLPKAATAAPSPEGAASSPQAELDEPPIPSASSSPPADPEGPPAGTRQEQ